jgi:hypothetical protein
MARQTSAVVQLPVATALIASTSAAITVPVVTEHDQLSLGSCNACPTKRIPAKWVPSMLCGP